MATLLSTAAPAAARGAATALLVVGVPLAARRRALPACVWVLDCGRQLASSSTTTTARPRTDTAPTALGLLPPPSWSLAELHRTAKADADGVDITDATVAHVAKLSHLALEPGSVEFERVKRSMASVLASTRAVQRIVAAKQQQDTTGGRGASTGGHAGPPPSHASAGAALPEDPLDGLSEAQFEALAAARYADLRRDGVTDGGHSERLLRHAPRSEAGCYSVPQVVGD